MLPRRTRHNVPVISQARADVLAAVVEALGDVRRPVLVAIDGADASGKTWFADDLATALRRDGVEVVRASVDDFHHPRAFRHEHGRTGETVWTRSYDYRALRRDLVDPWLAGCGTAYRTRLHDLASDSAVEESPSPVPATGVLVVDGVFAQRPELAEAWDLVVWLDAPDAERARRMARPDSVAAELDHPDQARSLDAQRIYADLCDPHAGADLVVDNTDPISPRLVDPELGEDACPTCGRVWVRDL